MPLKLGAQLICVTNSEVDRASDELAALGEMAQSEG